MKLHLVVATVFLLFTTPLALAAESGQPGARGAALAAGTDSAAADTPAVNINAAGLMALMSLKGVGERKAEAIIAFRREHGPFMSAEQLEAVPGIGPAILQANRDRIVFR